MSERKYQTNNLHSQRLEDVIHELEKENARLREALEAIKAIELRFPLGGKVLQARQIASLALSSPSDPQE